MFALTLSQELIMLMKIATPSGACPVPLEATDREGVVEWAKKVRAIGLKSDRHYTIGALRYWGKDSPDIDPRSLVEWLAEEWPEERPLTPHEWYMLLVEKGKDKAAKEARKAEREARKDEPKAEKTPKTPVDRDAMGNRVGSQANLINVAFLAGHRTSAALCKATGFNSGRMAGHLKFLVDHGFATKVGDEYIPVDPSASPAVKDEIAPKAEPKAKKDRSRFTVFGLNACSVCRALGAKGWDFDDVTLALETLGCKGMSHATMKMHYVAGKKSNNRWGEPAKLTKKHLVKLTEAAK